MHLKVCVDLLGSAVALKPSSWTILVLSAIPIWPPRALANKNASTACVRSAAAPANGAVPARLAVRRCLEAPSPAAQTTSALSPAGMLSY